MPTIETRTKLDGSKVFRARVRIKGFPPQQATFSRKTDAVKWAQATAAAIHEGRYFHVAQSRRHSVAELIDRYERDVLPHKPKSAKDQRQQLRWWRAEVGHLNLSELTAPVISQCRDKLLREPMASKKKYPPQGEKPRYRSPATVSRYMAALSHPLTVAVKEWQWLEHNPFENVRKPKEPRGRDRYLSDEERERLLDASRRSGCKLLYGIVVLALSTGMRRNELMMLTWDQVDIKHQRIILRDTKNGEVRSVPLAGQALEILEAIYLARRRDSCLVFPGAHPLKALCIGRPWKRALKQAGITNFRFHDLRHSAASYLAMNGATQIEIAGVLGHKTLQMVKRYSHLSDAHTHRVVAAMNDKIFGDGRTNGL